MIDEGSKQAGLVAPHGYQAVHEKKFPVMEIFGPVLQGEGVMAGVPTMFIRMGGCDFRCTMCDSMHAVDPQSVHKNARYLTAKEIFQELEDKCPEDVLWVTFSGGNPAIWQLNDLVERMKHLYKIAVETQGTIWNSWLAYADCLTVSPKGPGMGEDCNLAVLDRFMHKATNLRSMLGSVINLKIVCFGSNDLDFAEKIFDRYPKVLAYISTGNPYLPGITDLELAELRDALLVRYRWLAESVMRRPKLVARGVITLPQLHVLMYGNEAER